MQRRASPGTLDRALSKSLINLATPTQGRNLDSYATYAQLAYAVQALRSEARAVASLLEGRRVWMVNSTAVGGGVAEMLPQMVWLLRELGIETDWVTITPEEQAFFPLTKNLHNLIHGEGQLPLTPDDKALYDRTSQVLADAMAPMVGEDDILVVHDPQPAGLGALLEKRFPSLVTIWRCHIGLDGENPSTKAVWEFLEPYITSYDHAVFSAPEYIPPYLSHQSTIIAPAIDPLSAKNRPLSVPAVLRTLRRGGMLLSQAPLVGAPFVAPVRRLRPGGDFELIAPGDLPLLGHPWVTQVSRWDRLKGWFSLIEGFARMKRVAAGSSTLTLPNRAALLCAGPDPASVQDDPEGQEVLQELTEAYARLDPETQRDVAILSLPMESVEENALLVNALQRASTLVVQNSLREGFGLTVSEALWKSTPVLGSGATGIRQQIRDGIEGRLIEDAGDPDSVASALSQVLLGEKDREAWALNGQRRVGEEFLLMSQLRKWLELLARSRDGTIQRPSTLPPEAG